MTCRNGARCEAGQCVCPTECPSPNGLFADEEDEEICGTDLNTVRPVIFVCVKKVPIKGTKRPCILIV